MEEIVMDGAELSDLTANEMLTVSGGISRNARCLASGALVVGGVLTGQLEIALWGLMFAAINCD